MAKATLPQITTPDVDQAFPDQQPTEAADTAKQTEQTEQPGQATPAAGFAPGALPSDPSIGAICNRTIFTGDNLHVLRRMDSDSVDLIYLDPPFNSKRDYAAPIGSKAAGAAFKDTWTLDDVDLAWHEEVEHDHPPLHAAILSAQQTAGDSTMSYLITMAPRLLEMRRILKPTGSIYLHCDDTESAYLRAIMDAIFGRAQFRNEIIWKRTAGRSDAQRFGRVHDVILYYAGEGATWNTQYLPHDPEYVERAYRNKDDRGRWQADQLLAAGTSGGESGQIWRGIDPGKRGRHWSTPVKGGMNEFLKNYIPGWPDAYESIHDRLDALDEHGFIYWPKKEGGMPRLKRYLASTNGVAVEDVFSDIGKLEAQSKEKTGYPTQKPVALLERIIESSSNPGDVVLDPFCGCATAAIAAEKTGRRWVGIDLSPKAIEMTEERLAKELGLASELAIHRTDLPQRTDQGDLPRYNSPENKNVLWAEQDGKCAGCGEFFPKSGHQVDHFIPRIKGGTDHIDNLQLLCGGCNASKGDRPMSYLTAKKLNRQGITYGGKVTAIVEAEEAKQAVAATEAAPDSLKELLAAEGLDLDETTSLLTEFVKVVAAHKAKENSNVS